MAIEYHDIVFTFPPLSKNKRQDLKASIQKDGCAMPIVFWEGKLIDGRHRHEICEEIGASYQRVDFKGTEAEAVALAESLNEDRRHSTPEQIAGRRERVAKARREGKSLRVIAEEEGVDAKTIQNDLEKQSTVEGSTVDPEDGKTTGKDGRKRPSKRKKKEPAPANDPDEEQPSSGRPQDGKEDSGEQDSKKSKGREPGSDNKGLGGLHNPPKNGSIVFDWTDFHSAFGKLSRQIDNLYRGAGKLDRHNAIARDADYDRVSKHLRDYLIEFKELAEKITGAKSPQ